jgi:hypothetical protein
MPMSHKSKTLPAGDRALLCSLQMSSSAHVWIVTCHEWLRTEETWANGLLPKPSLSAAAADCICLALQPRSFFARIEVDMPCLRTFIRVAPELTPVRRLEFAVAKEQHTRRPCLIMESKATVNQL